MISIDQLINHIERFEPKDSIRDLAIKRVHYNRGYFLRLLNRKTDWRSLYKEIFKWYIENHQKLLQKKVIGIHWGLGELEKVGDFRPLNDLEKDAYKKEAGIIAKHIWSLNQEMATEDASKEDRSQTDQAQNENKLIPVLQDTSIDRSSEPAATSKARRARGAVDRDTAFKGLKIPKNPLLDSYFRGLTELQEVCLKLKYDHGLSAEKIGQRLDRRKSTVQGILKTAEKRIEERNASLIKERNRAT